MGPRALRPLVPNGAGLALRLRNAISSGISQAVPGRPLAAEETAGAGGRKALQTVGRTCRPLRPSPSHNATAAGARNAGAEAEGGQARAGAVAESEGLQRTADLQDMVNVRLLEAAVCNRPCETSSPLLPPQLRPRPTALRPVG